MRATITEFYFRNKATIFLVIKCRVSYKFYLSTLKYLINEHENKHLIKEHCGIWEKINEHVGMHLIKEHGGILS